jgi:uncharacterized damage-inducible protein DinB
MPKEDSGESIYAQEAGMEGMKAVLDSLKQAPSVLSAFVGVIPESKLDVRRGEGFWTIAEHVSHLAQVQPMLLERIQRFIAEERPEFVPYIPDEGDEGPGTPTRMEMAMALGQFRSVRERQLAELARAADSVWQRQAVHPEYEQYSLTILARHILMHDYWHMYRMEELWLTRAAYLTELK